VLSPMIFEINRQNDGDRETRMVAAHKQVGARTPKLSLYLSTPWQPSCASRAPLPPALDLPRLYDALLTPLLQVTVEPGENVADALSRVDEARRLKRELASLERCLRNEPQFNRKVELRRQIRDRTATLNALTTSGPSTTQEASWTS
jgi:hypothetical protein